MAEDRKFKFEDGKFINRVSGEAIPDDEPVIIFRARDWNALDVLEFYQRQCVDGHHVRAIQDRINEFQAFKDEFPDRMKEPGVTRHIRLNDDKPAPTEPLQKVQQLPETVVAGDEREAIVSAIYHAVYGAGYDPHHHPEGWDFAEKIADAALAALSQPTQAPAGGEGVIDLLKRLKGSLEYSRRFQLGPNDWMSKIVQTEGDIEEWLIVNGYQHSDEHENCGCPKCTAQSGKPAGGGK